MTGVHVPPPTHHGHPHHFGPGGGSIEPHSAASATMLHELRQSIIDSVSLCRETTRLEWVGFSWVVSMSAGRGRSLDPEGNPHVFLTRLVPQYGHSDAGSDTGSDSDIDDWAPPGEPSKWVEASTMRTTKVPSLSDPDLSMPSPESFQSEKGKGKQKEVSIHPIDPSTPPAQPTTSFPASSSSPSSAPNPSFPPSTSTAQDKGKGKAKLDALPSDSLSSEAQPISPPSAKTTPPSAEARKTKRDRRRDPGLSWFWPENDLNVGDVQGVRMWEKEVWSGRL